MALLEAREGTEGWDGIAGGVRAGLELAAVEPGAARTLTVEAIAHGVEGVDRYERLVAYLSEQLEPGWKLLPEKEQLPGVIEHALASGVLMLVAQRVDQGRVNELSSLVPEVVQFVLTPYLGASEALRVSERF